MIVRVDSKSGSKTGPGDLGAGYPGAGGAGEPRGCARQRVQIKHILIGFYPREGRYMVVVPGTWYLLEELEELEELDDLEELKV